jgi:hypothetical protein
LRATHTRSPKCSTYASNSGEPSSSLVIRFASASDAREPFGASGLLWNSKPTGTSRSIRARIDARLSGRSAAIRSVFTASMPQPMSTPTAEGTIAARVGITVTAAAGKIPLLSQ